MTNTVSTCLSFFRQLNLLLKQSGIAPSRLPVMAEQNREKTGFEPSGAELSPRIGRVVIYMEFIRPKLIQQTVTDRLFKSRIVVINGEITQELVGNVNAQLLALAPDSDDPITMFIHSQGGHVESGDSIHDMIRFIDTRVRVVGSG